MGIFFITTAEKQAVCAKRELEMLYCQADLYHFDHIYFTITCAYKKNYQMKRFKHHTIYILGTIFNERGFNEQLLHSYKDETLLLSDIKNEKQLFFGHYLVIAISHQGSYMEIIPDRIGMLNTYYSIGKDHEIFISNDMLLVSKLSHNSNLCMQAVYEFVMTESNVGENTIFQNVHRMKMGNMLVFQQQILKETRIYHYCISCLSKTEYAKRIQVYFKCFRHYKKKLQ